MAGVKRLRVARNGTFRGSLVPAGAGRYRYYVASRADRLNARGASERLDLRVAGAEAGAVSGGER